MIQRWLQTRGINDQKSFEEFYNFSLKNLADPSSIKDMDIAVERLIEAYAQGEKICLYADFDMDGTPGLALLIRGLQFCGFENLLSFQPNRFDDGYGVHTQIVEEFISSHNISLFVTVDVGITDVKAVKRAKELGVDFIITDHHQAKESLPEAHAIVNPNQPDCESGLKHLCGTGVAFYLILALRRQMTELGLLEKNFDPKKLLDCFAIGTLTDMVPLVRENRPLVKHGLLQLAKTDRLGLRGLMENLGLTGRWLTSSDVAISLSPKLNALGRMNSDVQALDLFLATDAEDIQQSIASTIEAQQSRVDIQRKGEEILANLVSNEENPTCLFSWSEDFYKGVVGLLATQGVKNFSVPSFVGAVIGDKIVGSARAPKGQNLLPGLESVSDHLVKFGGHKQAAGYELKLSEAETVKTKLQEYYASQPRPESVVTYDFEAELSELNHQFKDWLKKLEPYGVGFELPRIFIKHLFVTSIRVLKEKHLKFSLKDISGNKIEALWFFADNIDEKRQLNSSRVSVVVEPSINFYMGKESLQLFIRELKVEYE